jgi:membrane associated rhomboid family serine protease
MFPLYDLNPHRRTPWITLLIIAANVAATIWMSSLSEMNAQKVALKYGFVPKRLSEVDSGQPVIVTLHGRDADGKIVPVGIAQLKSDPQGTYATLLTTMFLHGGWLHLLSNMWILWIFGNNIEDRLGHLLYLGYYLVGGLAATLCHWAFNAQSEVPVVGASGAVATVLGGYAITYPWAKVRTLVIVGLIFVVDIPALIWLGIWFVLQNVVPFALSLQGLKEDPVAYLAHIGGFLAGIALMPLLSLGASPPGADWRREAEEMFRFDEEAGGSSKTRG